MKTGSVGKMHPLEKRTIVFFFLVHAILLILFFFKINCLFSVITERVLMCVASHECQEGSRGAWEWLVL